MCVGLLACLFIGRSLLPDILLYADILSFDASSTTSRQLQLQPHHSHSFQQLAAPHSFNTQPSFTPSRASRCTVTSTANQNINHTFLVRSCHLLPCFQTPEASQPSLDFGLPSLSIAQPHLSTVTYKGRRQHSPFTCTLLSPTIKSHLLVSIAPHSTPR
jgi:hypothetical protein